MLDGLRERVGRVKVAVGWWLMSAGLRLVGVGFVGEPADEEPEDDEPVPAQDPLTAEAAAMIVQPRAPAPKPPPPPPLKGSARERYHAHSRRAVH